MRNVALDPFVIERRRLKARPRTMTSMAVLATLLAMPIPARPAWAAGFVSNNLPTGPGFTVNANKDLITVTSPTAIVNWTVDSVGGGNAVDFLPSGNTATFQSEQSAFTVLNRITSSEPLSSLPTCRVHSGGCGDPYSSEKLRLRRRRDLCWPHRRILMQVSRHRIDERGRWSRLSVGESAPTPWPKTALSVSARWTAKEPRSSGASPRPANGKIQRNRDATVAAATSVTPARLWQCSFFEAIRDPTGPNRSRPLLGCDVS